VTYSYQVSGAKDHSTGEVLDNISLTVTDVLNASSTDSLDILILDTQPTANADTRTVSEDDTSISGNVINGQNASKDTLGADTTSITGVSAGTSNTPINTGVSTAITGTYGSLTIDSSGNYSYVLNTAAQQLNQGEQPTDTFSYTLKDSDGDTSTTTVTFTVEGVSDGRPSISINGNTSTRVTVDGEVTEATSETITGVMQVTAPDGIVNVSIDGQDITQASQSNPVTITGGLHGSLVITSYDAASGNITYSYTEDGDNEQHDIIGDNINDHYTVKVTDSAGQSSTNSLDIRTLDTAPIAIADANTVSEDDTNINGNVITGLNGTKDELGADITQIIGVSAGSITTAITAGVNTEIDGTYGTLTIDNAGNYNYVLNAVAQQLAQGDQPTDTFSYTIQDSDGDVSITELVFTVNGQNDAPETDDVSVIGYIDTAVAINLTGQDIDGSVDSFILSSLPTNGTLYTDVNLTTPVSLTDSNGNPVYYDATNDSLTLYFLPDSDWNGDTDFQYNAHDDSGFSDQSPATANISIVENIVYEAGLTDGTLAGNLENNTSVSGSLFSDANSVTTIDSINGINAISGVITVTTLQGNTLTVNADPNSANFGQYNYSLNNTVNHSLGNNEQVFSDIFSYKITHADNSTTSTDLKIDIIDDSPVVGNDQAVNIEINNISSNLTFIVDASGSMSEYDMKSAIDAVKALIIKYQEFSNVNINIVMFREPIEGYETTSTGWINDYPADLDLSTYGATDIAQGLNTVMDDVYGDTSNYQPATQDVIYYFGDGGESVNSNTYTKTMANWKTFLEQGEVDALFTYSINNLSISEQESIARVADAALDAEGEQGSVYRPLETVEGYIDLTDAVLDDIATPIFGNLLIDGNADAIIDFGADGGHIDSLTINGTTHVYDQDNPVQIIAGLDGLYTVNFETGAYNLLINTDVTNQVDHQDQMQVIVVDRDGDKSTPLQLTFNLTFAQDQSPQTVNTISDAQASNGGELLFNIEMNGLSSTPRDYNVSITNNQTTVTDYSQLHFSNGVTLNNNGTITVPAGVSRFTASLPITDDGDLTAETLNLTIGGVTATGSIDVSNTWSTPLVLETGSFDSGAADDIMTIGGINGPVIVSTGAGDDSISVDNSIKGTTEIDTGSGNDIITVSNTLSGAAQVKTGLGDDTISIGTSMSSSANIDTGAGNDQITIGGRLLNNAVIKMGAGDDQLTINEIGPVIASDNKKFSGHIDMGTGDDTLTIEGAVAKARNVINLGDGQDTLVLSQMSSSDFELGLGNNSTVSVTNGIQSIQLIHQTTAGTAVDMTIKSAETIIFGGDNTIYTYDWASQKYLLTSGGTTNTATVIDGIIAGLEYTTSSGISGLTTAEGGFEFNAGDIVTFNIGNVVIGDIDMAQINDGQVFLQDIAQTSRQDMSDQYVENMAVLLQTLDNNSDAYDGIVITEVMRNAFSDANFDLATTTEQELVAIILDQTGRQAISDEAAMTHVGDMLAEYADITVNKTSSGTDGSEIFKWLSDGNETTTPITEHINDFDITQGDQLDLSDILSVNSDGSLNQYLAINFDNGDTTLEIHAGDQSSPVSQVLVLNDVDLSKYATDSETLISGLLNNPDGPLIISSAADDRLVGIDDDLSNGFND